MSEPNTELNILLKHAKVMQELISGSGVATSIIDMLVQKGYVTGNGQYESLMRNLETDLEDSMYSYVLFNWLHIFLYVEDKSVKRRMCLKEVVAHAMLFNSFSILQVRTLFW